MSKHIFLYELKYLFRVRIMLFWNLIFPALLVTFMHLAFSNLYETIKTIPVAVESKELSSILEEIEYKNIPLFHVIDVNEEDISQKLKEDAIMGYISGETDYNLKITENDLSTDIVKNILNNINHKKALYTQLIAENNGNNQEEIIKAITNQNPETALKSTSIGGPEDSPYNILYFSVLTMSIVLSASLGLHMIENSLQSVFARRQLLGNINKIKIIASKFMANLLCTITLTLILFSYMIYVLKISFGTQTGLTIGVSIIGIITGLLLGIVTGMLFKQKLEVKHNILAFFSIFAGFLSGLMSPELSNLINNKLPILKRINPSYLITDSFYSIYFYEGHDRLLRNLFNIGVINLVFIALIVIASRRKYYEYN